jgi:hypothetical protein
VELAGEEAFTVSSAAYKKLTNIFNNLLFKSNKNLINHTTYIIKSP